MWYKYIQPWYGILWMEKEQYVSSVQIQTEKQDDMNKVDGFKYITHIYIYIHI